MTKGSVGTSMTIEYARTKALKHKKGYKWCIKCRKSVKKGEWVIFTPQRTYRHFKECPKKIRPAEPVKEKL